MDEVCEKGNSLEAERVWVGVYRVRKEAGKRTNYGTLSSLGLAAGIAINSYREKKGSVHCHFSFH
jgi:hypothetical protein